MTVLTDSVQIRRITYGSQSQPLTAVVADDPSDGVDSSVLDAVMKFNPYWSITSYHWDNTIDNQVAD